jgi:gentisate 1,2-dioxygenase
VVNKFDPGAFIAQVKTMDHVHPAIDEPLVVRGSEQHWFGPEELKNPSRIAIVGDLPTRTFELFLQEIEAGGSSDMQRHHHETVHYVISGTGHSQIEDAVVTWGTGDFVYTPVWTWHRHFNDSDTEPVRMLGIENSRLLDLLGGLNRRQSMGLATLDEARATDLT